MPNCVRPGNPNPLVGVPTIANCASLTDVGLVCAEQQTCSDTVPAGSVISQAVSAGTMLPAGSTVAFVVSTGPCVNTDVTLAAFTSCAEVVALGLVCLEGAAVCDAIIPVGGVISQTPPAGTVVAAGSQVTLVFSTGPCTSEVTVPTALTCADIEAVGLTCNVIEQRCVGFGGTVLGDILSQDPVGGTLVSPGSTVDVIVSDGTDCPDVIIPDATSCAELEAAGFQCQVLTECSDTVPLDGVIRLFPPAGFPAPGTSTVTITFSTGPCPVDVTLPLFGAISEITNLGLVAVEGAPICDPVIPAGGIVSQDPVAGTVVAAGSTVTVILSTGPCVTMVPLPSFTDCFGAEAQGFTCMSSTECSDTVAANSVISQTPPAGTMVAPGSAVVLVISSGPCSITLPSFANCAEITAAGFSCVGILECSDTVAVDGVISQNPVAGTVVPAGSTVTLTISTGVRCTIPVFLTCANVESLGLVCNSFLSCHPTIPVGSVISQDPVAGSPLIPGSTVVLEASSGPCVTALPLIAPPCYNAGDAPFPEEAKPFVEAAIAKWNEIIPTELSPISYNGNPNFTQIEICFQCTTFADPQVLGFGGPTQLRTSGANAGLPINGLVQFNCDRLAEVIADGRIGYVFLHEIAHVLGFGTISAWTSLVLNDNTANACFSGVNAVAAYNAINPGPDVTCVPMADDGNHWPEIAGEGLLNSLMSPQSSGNNEVSQITIAAMLDIGYPVVDPSACPPFVFGQA